MCNDEREKERKREREKERERETIDGSDAAGSMASFHLDVTMAPSFQKEMQITRTNQFSKKAISNTRNRWLRGGEGEKKNIKEMYTK